MKLRGLTNETLATPNTVALAPACAVICTDATFDAAGAVYRPEEVIVPLAGDPPSKPSTAHVTCPFKPLWPNWMVWPGESTT
jgi:hypothetical protein